MKNGELLERLIVDHLGRTLLSDDLLDKIEKTSDLTAGGGMPNISCPGDGMNSSCSNSPDCSGTHNTMCNNEGNCDMASNGSCLNSPTDPGPGGQ